MKWEINTDPDFETWLLSLERAERVEILAHVDQLQAVGPNLGRPYVDTVKGSRFPNMKELRIQHEGDPWRVLFAFDPARQAILPVGGNKRGDARWYKKNVPIADQRYQRHLDEMKEHGEQTS